MRNLINHLPPFLRDIREYEEIDNTEQTELVNVYEEILKLVREVSSSTAMDYGLDKYESILGIVSDTETETIEFRRERIQSKLISQTPFSEAFLTTQLNMIIGENQWYYNLNYNNYTLDIYITTQGRSWLKELYNLLESIVPCNIVWNVYIYAANWETVNRHFRSWYELREFVGGNGTWQDVEDGEWIRG